MLELTLKLTGVSPLLMHNPRMSDPLDPLVLETKKLTGKRKKTQDDLAAIDKLEWHGGLYVEEGVGLSVPTANVRACLVEAAKTTKQGKQTQRAVIFRDIHVPLIYDGPKDLDKLYEKPEFRFRTSVVQQRSRVWRVRPSFPKWSLEVPMLLTQDMMDPEDLKRIAVLAGQAVGLGDYRVGGFGRFEAVVENGS